MRDHKSEQIQMRGATAEIRLDLPARYGKHAQRTGWASGEMHLTVAAPEDTAEIVDLWREIAIRGIREMIARPPESVKVHRI